jgi:hypothetical protein
LLSPAPSDAIEETAAKLGIPPTLHTTFAGMAQAYKDSLGNELVLIMAALAAVYIVLGILYESYIHPITILSTSISTVFRYGGTEATGNILWRPFPLKRTLAADLAYGNERFAKSYRVMMKDRTCYGPLHHAR